MTGAVTVAAVVGLLSLLGGVALGWHLRRTNEWCPSCGDQMSCQECGKETAWPTNATPARPLP
ncbi:hypothetical protein [Actinoplanes solisilvae]|uniref:hypothetical protein n=1 Tax=Actinoplanes solisilvae TaxID=2486853 RepID=UPI000FDB2B6B|nr:hypothetical protein [Actinoplanes solisilvae]